MKQDKFLKYLKLILESQKEEEDDEMDARIEDVNDDDEDFEIYSKTGRMPSNIDDDDLEGHFKFMSKHYFADEVDAINKLNRLLNKAGAPRIRFDLGKSRFQGEELEQFIDGVTNLLINLNYDQRSAFTVGMSTHSFDYGDLVEKINNFIKSNRDEYPDFCDRMERLFHPVRSDEIKINELFEREFLKELMFLKDEPIIKSNEEIYAVVEAFIRNLKRKNSSEFQKQLVLIQKEAKKIEYQVDKEEVMDIVQTAAKEYNRKASEGFDERKIKIRLEELETFKKDYPELFKKIKDTREFKGQPIDKWYIGNSVYSLMRDAGIDEDVIKAYRKKIDNITQKWYKEIKTDYVDTANIIKILNGNLSDSHYIDDLIRLMKVMDKNEREEVKQYIEQEKLFKDPELDNL
jgi:hypothetical protein